MLDWLEWVEGAACMSIEGRFSLRTLCSTLSSPKSSLSLLFQIQKQITSALHPSGAIDLGFGRFEPAPVPSAADCKIGDCEGARSKDLGSLRVFGFWRRKKIMFSTFFLEKRRVGWNCVDDRSYHRWNERISILQFVNNLNAIKDDCCYLLSSLM